METGRRGGNAERAAPTPRVADKIRRDILAVAVTAEEQGVPAPHQAPSPGLQSQEEKSA